MIMAVRVFFGLAFHNNRYFAECGKAAAGLDSRGVGVELRGVGIRVRGVGLRHFPTEAQ